MRETTISEAARQAGVGVETIRFYERRGLIAQPPKPQGSGYRVYTPEQIKRVRFIRQAQQVGLSLRDIEELLALRADSRADCADVQQQVAAKLEEVEERIEQLHRIRSALQALIAVCPGHGGLQACSILDTFADPHPRLPPRAEPDGAGWPDPPKRRGRNGSAGAVSGSEGDRHEIRHPED